MNQEKSYLQKLVTKSLLCYSESVWDTLILHGFDELSSVAAHQLTRQKAMATAFNSVPTRAVEKTIPFTDSECQKSSN